MSATTGTSETPAEPRLYVYARRNWGRWHVTPAELTERALCGQRPPWTSRRDQLPAEEWGDVCRRCRDHIWRGKAFVKLRGALWGPGEVGR
jgi:hypothetical protein